MVPGGGSCDTCPDLLKPHLVAVGGDYAKHTRSDTRAAVSPRLALHEDELDVVFYDRVRLIGLPEETTAIALRLIYGVGNLVPDNGSQVAEPDPPAMFLD